MKNSKFFKLTILSLLASCLGLVTFSVKNNSSVEVSAYTTGKLPTTIDLNKCSHDEIRNYYASLNGLEDDERHGNNLLKNLKPILKENQVYFNYDSGEKTWNAYEIVNRDWGLSPAKDIKNGTYNSETNTITNYQYHSTIDDPSANPYIHALYVDRNKSNVIRAWGNHTQKEGGFQREHIWPKSYGFKDKAQAGARGDLMNLWPGDGHTNNLHNDLFFGNVSRDKIEKDTSEEYFYLGKNYVGYSVHYPTIKVFEPQDCDKGDIARSLFYMAARYNNFANEQEGFGSNEPNLLLTNTVTIENGTSTATKAYKYGILKDLLQWNKIDPVDDYEIKRNDLLYKNFTKNRNPFIDFPEWADLIWGNSENIADSSNDRLFGRRFELVGDYKTEFIVGETFNYENLNLKYYHSDLVVEIIKDGYSVVVPDDVEELGQHSIKVIYENEYGTYELSYVISVVEPKKGCGASISSTTIIVPILSIIALRFIFIKKRKEN